MPRDEDTSALAVAPCCLTREHACNGMLSPSEVERQRKAEAKGV